MAFRAFETHDGTAQNRNRLPANGRTDAMNITVRNGRVVISLAPILTKVTS
jgi:hypothetical protein